MTYLELAQIFVDDGLGEATILAHFSYREGKTFHDVGKVLRDGMQKRKRGETEVECLARHLEKVVEPKAT